ncbi:MAG: histidine phosphatase family protein [Longimicrobiales bacterium]|nr:histidine phosphatase family protein [Longimicrobiales bacterium]
MKLMSRRSWSRAAVHAVALAILLPAPAPMAAQRGAAPAEASLIYLVRHAERAQDDPRDPRLAPAGEARAEELARVLAGAPLTGVFSTDLRRTRATARPVAAAHGLEVEVYDSRPAGLAALAAELRARPGHHLVVGHSNTTPELVGLLGGDPGPPIPESEYDRLYVVLVWPAAGPVGTETPGSPPGGNAAPGGVTSTLLRYGARSGAAPAGGDAW